MKQPGSDDKPDDAPPPAGPLPRSPVRTGGALQPANEAEAPPDDPANGET